MTGRQILTAVGIEEGDPSAEPADFQFPDQGKYRRNANAGRKEYRIPVFRVQSEFSTGAEYHDLIAFFQGCTGFLEGTGAFPHDETKFRLFGMGGNAQGAQGHIQGHIPDIAQAEMDILSGQKGKSLRFFDFQFQGIPCHIPSFHQGYPPWVRNTLTGTGPPRFPQFFRNPAGGQHSADDGPGEPAPREGPVTCQVEVFHR